MNQANLGNLYTGFSRIDLDSRGGYARVAQVKTRGQENFPEHCAFKVMRSEIDPQKGMAHFQEEIKLLIQIANNPKAPSAITRIYDCGFVAQQLSQVLHEQKNPSADLHIHSAGIDIQKFLELKALLWTPDGGKWLPYLVVELAPYNDSLLRQLHQQPVDDEFGLYRLPTGEVIAMAMQLLDVMEYLHTEHRKCYLDWKPEHIFWGGLKKQVKLIDWNVTISLDDGSVKQNIRDDIRLLCGAVLYIGLTFVDPDSPAMPIGPRPTTNFSSPTLEIRNSRYATDNPNFYQRGITLDNRIKQIISRGLNPHQGFASIKEFKAALVDYATQELGLVTDHDFINPLPETPYFKALAEIRAAQQKLLEAQHHLLDATELRGETPEFTRLSKIIKRSLVHYPIS